MANRSSLHGGIEFLTYASGLTIKSLQMNLSRPLELHIPAKDFDELKKCVEADAPHFPDKKITIGPDSIAMGGTALVKRLEEPKAKGKK